MNTYIAEISIYQLLLYIAFGTLQFLVFYIIRMYIIPLLKGRQAVVKKYWQKIEILAWLVFSGLFFIALFRVNMVLTLIFTAVVLGLGWSFWRNIFSGIVIKFTDQFKLGEVISTGFATGELKSVNLAQSELVNDEGELVNIPNYKLRTAVLKHLYKKSSIQTHTFKVVGKSSFSVAKMHQVACSCPYLSANQNIEIERLEDNLFQIKASIIDNAFTDQVDNYFSSLSLS